MQPAANLTDALLELFETELPGVCFPEVDATSLIEHRDAVLAAVRVVEEAEQALALATGLLAERKQALALQGKRALAYVRVYAEERPALRERLDTMQSARGKSLPLELAAGESRRRGRPRKIDPVAQSVLLDAAPAELAQA